ncbi:MAG: AAA family ATPase [Verrucomicrobiales bacterium]|nr:AAA family ATPase [Verrucomicrobiales bacterium]
MARYRSQGLSLALPKRTLDYLQHGATEGLRNAELFDATCQFRDAGQSLDAAEGQLLARALADGLTEAEARQTIRSAFNRTAREPVAARPAGSDARQAQKSLSGPPEPVAEGFLKLLSACFADDEHVSIAPAAESEEGEIMPRRGVTLTAAEWKAKAHAKGGIDKVFGTKLGLFLRINPMTKGGARNDEVTAFRHVLVEFDRNEAGERIPKENQYHAIVASGLPVSALIDSGNKSLHAWVRVDAPDDAEYKRRVEVIWKWFSGMNLDRQNRNPSRLSRCPDGWRTVDGEVKRQCLLAVALGAESWTAWEAAHAGSDLPRILPGDQFMAVPEAEPPQLIEGVLHKGAKMVLGGPSKARKSWSLLDLMLSVSSGVPWWGFATQPGRALYLNFELPAFALQHRLRVIAAAKGLDAFTGFDVWNLRGHATDFTALIPKILGRIRDTGYALILIDPIYKGLGNRNENDAGDIASLLNEVEQLAAKSGAAVVFGAHFSKGNQSGKEAIDRIGGSGVFARDPDVILTMTPHEDDGAHTIDLTLRALPPVKAFVVRWDEAVFTADHSADPARLKAAEAAQKPAKPTANYRSGTMADRYGKLLENMPPLTNGRVPEYSEVIAYIRQQITDSEGDCTIKEADRIFHCLASMKVNSPLVFDRATRLWRGRRHGI